MTPRRAPGAAELLMLFAIGATWGGSFPATKLAVATLDPVTVVAARIVLGAAAMGAIAWALGQRVPRDPRQWFSLALIAVVGTVLPFLLITYGQRTIDAGLAAILMAAMPLVTLVLAHFFTLDEKMTPRRLLGVLLGLAGVVALVGVDALEGLGADVLGQLAVTGGAVCFAVQALIARRLDPAAPFSNTAAILAIACVLILPPAFLWGAPQPPALSSALGVIYLGLASTGIGYILFLRLIARAGVTFAANNNYLVPVMGVVWSALLLGERPSARAVLALALILAGIALAHFPARRG